MSATGLTHGLAGVSDAGAFLARLARLNPAAPVRLCRAGAGVELWAMLPWNVLVTRTVRGGGCGDVTVSAGALLAELAKGGTILPPARDGDWRWPLPPNAVEQVERVPASRLRRIGAAAAGTLREAAESGVRGRPVGQRVLRDALLDHVAITVTTPSGPPIEVPQRLVQAVLQMGFLGAADAAGQEAPVGVRSGGDWVGLAAPFGTAWLRTAHTLSLRPRG
ncbi:hypothetical protein [Rhizomonospora bruguierae]|uniref:hypothetical protein n=1 Tax=Rhizomonospora bruguierae TaxID=1581705 RepID=UPI001BCDE3C3|nr:hypothetical protein [Micromonospora sp. NBRC 107566]